MDSNKKIRLGMPDFEYNFRKVIKGTDGVRRWSSDKKPSVFAKVRRGAAQLMQKSIDFQTMIMRKVDSWQSTFETVTGHSLKQSMQVIKMLTIEGAHGNPHNLDFYRLLRWSLGHDLPEGMTKDGDGNYYKKRKDKETLAFHDKEEANAHREIMEGIFSPEYEDAYLSFPISRVDPDKKPEEQPHEIFWKAAEQISHCYFMLEEINLYTVDRARRKRWHDNVMNVHIEWLKNNAMHFVSVREIVEKELVPKWCGVIGNL